jgi:type VI secretion system secreted protein VgrG
MPLSQQERTLSVSTPLGEDVLLIRSMSAAEALSTLFEYQLDLVSEDINIRAEDLLGKPATMRLTLPDDSPRFFNGIFSRFSHVGFDGPYAIYQATLVPWLWFLTRTADCRIYQEKTVPDIVKEIFREHGFTDFEERLSGEYRQWVYCVQYRETDFNFISRLLEQEGVYYYFTHEDGKHTLILADSYSAHNPTPGYEEVPYYPPDESALRERDHIQDWSVASEARPGVFSQNDFDFTAPKKDLLAKNSNPKSHDLSELEIYDYPGEYKEPGTGSNYARIRLEEIQADYETARAEGNARGLATGALFSLTNYRREDQNKEYLILSAGYEVRSDLFGSGAGLQSGPYFRCAIRVMDAQIPYRPARVTPKPVVQGPQTAMVVGKAGEEIWTEKFGQVKIQFHWDRYGKFDENSSCWVRVSHPWAGKGWGSVAIPRIGQEVIVDFLEGDPDQPIVTGRVYNKDSMPPYGLPSGAVVSGLKSNSTKGGGGYNEISMDDTKGKEKITVHGQYDMSTTVEHDDSQTVHNNRTITVDGTHTETIKKDTTIKITTGALNHDVVSKTATYHVKGAVKENFDDTQTTTVNKKIAITSSSAEIHVTAAKEIVLTTGDSQLSMKADGSITLSGKKITIVGSEYVKSSAKTVDATATKEAKMGVGTQSVTCNNQKVQIGGAAITSAAVGTHEITGAIVKIN